MRKSDFFGSGRPKRKAEGMEVAIRESLDKRSIRPTGSTQQGDCTHQGGGNILGGTVPHLAATFFHWSFPWKNICPLDSSVFFSTEEGFRVADALENGGG